MIDDVLKDAKKRMDKSIEALKTDFAKLRTGRAHPSLLDHVHVDYYGSEVPIGQAANVTASDARTLAVTPYDKSMVAAIEKAILNSDLGLNPATAGEVIRIPLPPLNEERRRELIKVVKQEAETARIAVRNIRRDANHTFKEMAKDKDISDDEERRAEDQIQTLTDKHVAAIDELLAAKEQEMMEI